MKRIYTHTFLIALSITAIHSILSLRVPDTKNLQLSTTIPQTPLQSFTPISAQELTKQLKATTPEQMAEKIHAAAQAMNELKRHENIFSAPMTSNKKVALANATGSMFSKIIDQFEECIKALKSTDGNDIFCTHLTNLPTPALEKIKETSKNVIANFESSALSIKLSVTDYYKLILDSVEKELKTRAGSAVA